MIKDTGLEFDKDGLMPQVSRINIDLLKQFDALAYYKLNPPKILRWEWSKGQILAVIQQNAINMEDKLRTPDEHITRLHAKALLENTETGNSYTLLVSILHVRRVTNNLKSATSTGYDSSGDTIYKVTKR